MTSEIAATFHFSTPPPSLRAVGLTLGLGRGESPRKGDLEAPTVIQMKDDESNGSCRNVKENMLRWKAYAAYWLAVGSWNSLPIGFWTDAKTSLMAQLICDSSWFAAQGLPGFSLYQATFARFARISIHSCLGGNSASIFHQQQTAPKPISNDKLWPQISTTGLLNWCPKGSKWGIWFVLRHKYIYFIIKSSKINR